MTASLRPSIRESVSAREYFHRTYPRSDATHRAISSRKNARRKIYAGVVIGSRNNILEKDIRILQRTLIRTEECKTHNDT